MTRALVALNPRAGGGRAGERWQRVRPSLSGRYACQQASLDADGRWVSIVERAVTDGVRLFFAAGGDGTVNLLLNALRRTRGQVPLERLVLGAVGLGSSNDFHKPIGRTAAGFPIRHDLGAAALRDVCRARYSDAAGQVHERCFLVSASVGVTAEANALFSGNDRLQRALRRRCFSLALVSAAVRSILSYRDFDAELEWQLDGRHIVRRSRITSLSLLKTPHLSGSLRFDTPAAGDDGLLGANLCEAMTRAQTLGVLVDLGRGRFRGRRGRSHWQTPHLVLACARPFALEFDGEVVTTTHAEFEVLHERIGVCA